MTEPEIRPRVDDDRLPMCRTNVPCVALKSPHFWTDKVWACKVDGVDHTDTVCPHAVKRLAEENRKLREWARRAGEVVELVLDAEAAIAPDVPIVFNLMEELLKTYPAATEDGVE